MWIFSTYTMSLFVVSTIALLHGIWALNAGVCYSPFHAVGLHDTPEQIKTLLRDDMQAIAASNFQAIRTYHAQFHGVNVVHAVHEAGLKVAIGIHMLSADKRQEYEYLDEDIAAAIEAATMYPEDVVAIYVGNENLENGHHGYHSAAQIVATIDRVRHGLQNTPGAQVPIGTVQRLQEWLSHPEANVLANASDIVGANIHPFFTRGSESAMRKMLEVQWDEFSNVYGGKSRLTETGWPSTGSPSPQGNQPSLSHAEAYFRAFNQWSTQQDTPMPFYFMMHDTIRLNAPDYESHFGLMTASGSFKFPLQQDVMDLVESSTGSQFSMSGSSSDSGENDSHEEIMDVAAESLEDSMTTMTSTTESHEDSENISNLLDTLLEPFNETNELIGSDSFAGSTEAEINDEEGIETELPGTEFDDNSSNSRESDLSEDSSSLSSSSSSAASESGSTIDAKDVIDDMIDNVNDTNHRHTQQPQKPVPAPQPLPPHPVETPSTSSKSGSRNAHQEELDAQRARSQVAREVSGKQDGAFFTLAGVIGLAGVAAVAVVAVYARQHTPSTSGMNDDPTLEESVTIPARDSTSSVYDDPLGTRFSSIVMVTPNGDGVCIL